MTLVFGAPTAWAQTQTIEGSGTTDTVPVFIDEKTIGNSPIEVHDGTVGISTPTPESTLRVDNNNSDDAAQPYAVYATLESNSNFSAAVRGDALAGDGGASGVLGVA